MFRVGCCRESAQSDGNRFGKMLVQKDFHARNTVWPGKTFSSDCWDLLLRRAAASNSSGNAFAYNKAPSNCMADRPTSRATFLIEPACRTRSRKSQTASREFFKYARRPSGELRNSIPGK